MSYMCDRARSITWGIEGGLPSIPHGVWLTRDGEVSFLGAVFSNVPLRRRATASRARRRAAAGSATRSSATRRRCWRTSSTATSRWSARGRTTASSCGRSTPSSPSTRSTRRRRRPNGSGSARERVGWLAEEPESIAERYRAGELDQLDLIRRYGVILDWGTGELLPRTTEQFRAMLQRRMVPHWG